MLVWLLAVLLVLLTPEATLGNVFQRVRIRSGEYPAAEAEKVPRTEGFSDVAVGGTEGTTMPLGCKPHVHRPTLTEPPEGNDAGVRWHPLQHAATVAAVGSFLGLAELSPDGAIPPLPPLYVPDHRRYSRGGTLHTLHWLSQKFPPGTFDWSVIILELLFAGQSLTNGEGPEAALAAVLPWADEFWMWTLVRRDGWSEGLFFALAMLVELLTHFGEAVSYKRSRAAGLLQRARMFKRPSPSKVLESTSVAGDVPTSCEGARASLVLIQEAKTRNLTFDAPVIALIAELMGKCDIRTVIGMKYWGLVWQALAFWARGRVPHGECPADLATESSHAGASTLLPVKLCQDPPLSFTAEVAEIVLLGASVFLFPNTGAEQCLIIELVLHATSTDGCYISQAGSNLRTLPQSFLDSWTCSLADGKLIARASAVSAFGTDAVLRCHFSMTALREVGLSVHMLALQVNTSSWHMGDLQLCREAGWVHKAELVQTSPKYSLTVCTGMMFTADKRLGGSQEFAPNLLEQWIVYHEALGVDHFVIYDSDGSAAASVRQMEAHKVTYYPNWPGQLPEKLMTIGTSSDCLHCLSTLAESHCLWKMRGLSQWVITLHSFDTYLTFGPGQALRPLLTSLEPQRRSIGTIALVLMDFGGVPRNSSWVLARFVHRVAEPVRVLGELGRGNPRDDCWLNHPGVTIKNPENVWGVYDHYARSRPGANDLESPHELMRANHYVDLFSERCSSRFLHCEVLDLGMLVISETLCSFVGLPPCCFDPRCIQHLQ